jgi:hypothetical protein
MTWINYIFKYFGLKKSVLVADENSKTLKEAVNIVKSKYGNKCFVMGVTNFRDLFKEIQLAKANKCPYDFALIHPPEDMSVTLVLNKTSPELKTMKYSDTQKLNAFLPKKI